MEANNKIILFDGVCNLCNGIVKFVIKRDPDTKLKFASLQSEFGQRTLQKFNLPNTNFDTFIFLEGDRYYDKSSAALKVARELNGFWNVFYILMIIPKPIRDFFYTLIAKNRYKMFGQREACMIPTPELKGRFLQ